MSDLFRQGLFGTKAGSIDELVEKVAALESDMADTKADVTAMQSDVATASAKADQAKTAVDALEPTEDILYKGDDLGE